VDPEDIGRLTEGQAWLKYGLAGRLDDTGASYGMNVFLQGCLWDLGSDGHTIVIKSGELTEGAPSAGAAIVNCWLDSSNTLEQRT
jgi:hypothetical protein